MLNELLLQEAFDGYPSLWVVNKQLKNEGGLPIEFRAHRFLIDIYNDLSPRQVLLKAPQIGATTMNVIKSFYVAARQRKDIIYTLPTQADVYDMVSGKVNRIIAQNPALAAWVADHDSVEQKKVLDNIIYYRGTFTSKQAMMVSSDLNVHDEVDASNPEVLTQYETRLQAKADGMRWYFSHPSLAGHGVDVYWQQSDKKEWFVECVCKEKFSLEWPRNCVWDMDGVERVNERYECHLCKAPITDLQRVNGEWKATAEGEFSGYHISQMICPWITAKTIVDAFHDPQKDKQYFYNYILGLPFVSGDDQVTPTQVLRNCVNEINDQSSNAIIGVDTGLPIHYVCMNSDGVFYYDTCTNYDQLASLLKRWPTSRLVADQGGDLIGIRELQQRFPGRVYLCYYRKDRKTQDVIRWGEGDDLGTVVVDRNKMIQLLVEQMRDIGRERLNGTPDEWEPFAEHWGNLYREKIVVKESPEKDNRSLYGNEYVWKRRGADHYVHAYLYAKVGMDKFARTMAKIVGTDVMAGIPQGRIVNQIAVPNGPATVMQGFAASDFKGTTVEI